MTLSDLQQDLYRRCRYSDTPNSVTVVRLLAFLNQRHRELLSKPGMQGLRDQNTSFLSIPGQAVYAMGANISRIKTIYDGTTNQLKLTERSVEWLRTVDPRLASTGTPESWVPLSWSQIQQQMPSPPNDICIVSTTNADGPATTVFVEYTTTDGYPVALSAPLGPALGYARLTTTGNVKIVNKCYLSQPAVGSVTLQWGANPLGVITTIAPGMQSGRYYTLQLWPKPSSQWTYQVDYTRDIPDMANPNDEPLLPPDFHMLLIHGALVDEYQFLDDSRVTLAQSEWERGMRRLQNYVYNNPDNIVVPGGSARVGWSNLGPWYPSGGWW